VRRMLERLMPSLGRWLRLISRLLVGLATALIALGAAPAVAARVGPVPDTCEFVTLAEAVQILGGPASQDGPYRETVRSGNRAFQESHCVYQRVDNSDAVLDIFLSRSLTKRPAITLGDLKRQCNAKRAQTLQGLAAGAVWSELPCPRRTDWSGAS